MQRILTFPLVVLVAAVMASGCGGGVAAEGGASPTGSSEGGQGSAPGPIAASQLSKAQYVERAEALCTHSREQREKALERYREDNEETLEEGGGGFEGSLQDVYLPSKEEELERLRRLGAPAGDEAKVEAFLTAFEQFVHVARELEGGPTERINRIAVRAGNLAGNYGLIECTYG